VIKNNKKTKSSYKVFYAVDDIYGVQQNMIMIRH